MIEWYLGSFQIKYTNWKLITCSTVNSGHADWTLYERPIIYLDQNFLHWSRKNSLVDKCIDVCPLNRNDKTAIYIAKESGFFKNFQCRIAEANIKNYSVNIQIKRNTAIFVYKHVGMLVTILEWYTSHYSISGETEIFYTSMYISLFIYGIFQSVLVGGGLC